MYIYKSHDTDPLKICSWVQCVGRLHPSCYSISFAPQRSSQIYHLRCVCVLYTQTLSAACAALQLCSRVPYKQHKCISQAVLSCALLQCTVCMTHKQVELKHDLRLDLEYVSLLTKPQSLSTIHNSVTLFKNLRFYKNRAYHGG